jgi:hypothetical protein
MSKYTEYREIAGRMKTVFRTNIDVMNRKVEIILNPISTTLDIKMPIFGVNEGKDIRVTIDGEVGEALFKTLKQIYE